MRHFLLINYEVCSSWFSRQSVPLCRIVSRCSPKVSCQLVLLDKITILSSEGVVGAFMSRLSREKSGDLHG